MSVLSQIRGFVRVFFRYQPGASVRHRGHAIAKTIKHGTTVIGGNVDGSMGNIGHSRREDIMIEASERYDASFGDK